ncbi:hypothetical protein VKT23_002175 [Stygiomarasmius scandens]|uniref:RlpA-like protein double-psi beta-barrel domain-containing protein n=1 Tax=Marasmiellus scandens TaxID=2682957 RepID=A0ABR1K172_9AGAR
MFFGNALLFSILTLSIIPNAYSSVLRRAPTATMTRDAYTRPHTLGNSYKFNTRDGWTTVNATDFEYKYRRDNPIETRREKSKSKSKTASYHLTSKLKAIKASALDHLTSTTGVKKLTELLGLKGIGPQEDVKVTWYTGHDLQNPSCWPSVGWAPTDSSFICALTMDGWTNKPQCFKFLEVCNGPEKCIFVRVVDTCAGCAPGSKHVDLTKSAFGQLADLGMGTLTVQMRIANDPSVWFEELWGPKH